MATTLLSGHVSPETAHVTADYPYGFRLRCQRRAWLECHPRHGYRFVTQTSNPKRPGLVWNKPKASTYATLGVMFLDDVGHVQWDSLQAYPSLADVEAFERYYGEGLTHARERTILAMLRQQAVLSHERAMCLHRLRAMAGTPVTGMGYLIRCGGQAYVSVLASYTFWTENIQRAFVVPDIATAEALITDFPHLLRGAEVIVQ